MNYATSLHLVSIERSLKRHRPSDIQDTLKVLRTQRSFTQTELATKLRVSCTTISNYETGARKCPPDKIEEWAAACGYKISFIVEEMTNETQTTMDATHDE